jgi:hypothetical protein
MERQRGTVGRIVKWGIVAVIFVLAVFGFRFMFGRPSFDADKVARAETRMWQAYYTGDKIQLGLQLIAQLRSQHGLSLFEAEKVGELFASAAMKFRSASGDYDHVCLPDLTKAYSLIKQATDAHFDPDKAARAELAWWVARRTQGQNSAEQVGEKIAKLYGLLYGKDSQAFEKAGLLRAQAAELRDSGGKDADWVHVEDLLRKSYRELKKAA